MATVPSAAAQYQPPNPLEEYARVVSLKNMLAQGQEEQQRIQATTQQNQLQQMALQDQQTMRAIAPNHVQKDDQGKVTGFDTEGFFNEGLAKGVNPNTVNDLRAKYATTTKDLADAGTAQLANEEKKNDNAYQVYESVRSVANKKGATPEETQAAYQAAVPKLAQLGVDVSKLPPQYPGDDALSQFEIPLGIHKQQLADAKTVAETNEAQSRGAEAQSAADLNQNKLALIQNAKAHPEQFPALVDQIIPRGQYPAANMRAKAQVQFYLAQGNVEGAQQAITNAANEVGAIEKEVNPQVVGTKIALAREEANARQQAAQGDPAVAGKMLADGSLTLADLKTRGTTPQFIEQASLAAQKINPNYNPADETIAEHVAKSPAANQFFGSANSLIQKGGTLDQLEELGKKLPQHKLPVLNTVDDWQKLASGKGPLAGYAATVLGAADDYSKVMGGGVGSDSARDKALKLFAGAASPEQRADAIDATRKAVQSQRDGRIGNNKFLQREYGVEVGGKKEITATGPNGHKIKLVNGKWVDAQTGATIQ